MQARSQGWIGAVHAVAAIATLMCQVPAQQGNNLAELTTPDGSRVVLLPTGDAPIVHWVVATPTGVLEDPPGQEGLTFALMQASMTGTDEAASRDLPAERKALAILDQLERGFDLARSQGMELTEAALASLQQGRDLARSLHAPLRWESALRDVPALGPHLHRVTDGTLLQLTTTPAGIPRVAKLLLQQREGGAVRGIHETFRAVRADLRAQRDRDSRDAMRREVLGLCYLAHPLGRAYAVPQGPAPLSLAEAMRTWCAIRQPERGCHVLVGGFDADQVAATLQAVFQNTRLPKVAAPPTAPPAESVAERRASLPRGESEALAIGYRLPPAWTRDHIAVLTEWLAGNDQARLPDALRKAGRTTAQVTATAPFPGHRGGLLLIEVETSEDKPAKRPLLTDYDAAIEQILAEAPSLDEVAEARTRVRSRTAPARLGYANLALQLAIDCGLHGMAAKVALREPGHTPPTQVLNMAQRVLARAGRAVVTRERRR